MSANLDRLKAAYKAWDDSHGASIEGWLQICSDSIRIRTVGHNGPGLAFGGARRTRNQAAEYLLCLIEEWSILRFSAGTFIENGERIAVFSRAVLQHRATGKSAEVDNASLWTFENGLAVEMVEVIDSAAMQLAATP